jgi:FMN phosphatase YigB (HAD superfamily)
METLIFPPDRDIIFHWISQQKTVLTDFQQEMYINGFPYAVFLKEKEQFKKDRDILLCTPLNETRDICKLLSVPFHLEEIQMTDAYISMFLQNCRFDTQILKFLKKWREYADLKLVSNLYSAYKPLLTNTSLEICFHDIFLSCDVKDKKPNDTMFQKTHYQDYTKKIFIGDNWLGDIVIPFKLGFDCYFINTWDQFIHTIFQKGAAFLLEKKDNYRIKEKYKKIASLYLDSIIDVEHIIPAADLEIIQNKLQFQFMKKIRIAENIKSAYLQEGASYEVI